MQTIRQTEVNWKIGANSAAHRRDLHLIGNRSLTDDQRRKAYPAAARVCSRRLLYVFSFFPEIIREIGAISAVFRVEIAKAGRSPRFTPRASKSRLRLQLQMQVATASYLFSPGSPIGNYFRSFRPRSPTFAAETAFLFRSVFMTTLVVADVTAS